MVVQLSESLPATVLAALAHENSVQDDEVISDLTKQGAHIPAWLTLMRTGRR